MKAEEKLVMYQQEFDAYKAELTCSDGEKNKIRNALADFMMILNEHGRTWPDERDYSEYHGMSIQHDNSKDLQTTKQNITRIRKFFAWLEKERTPLTQRATQQEIPLDDEPDTIQGINEPSQAGDNAPDFSQGAGLDGGAVTENAPDTWPEITHDVPTQGNEKPMNTKNGARKNAGRKPLDTVNGESKTEKMMMYFTPTLFSDIRAWCDLKGISCVGYITTLIEADIATHKDKINSFLELRGNA